MRMLCFWRCTLLAALCCLFPLSAGASGVDADSVIEKILVGSGKSQKEYVLMNSALNQNQWYYALLSPQLLETGKGKNLEPDLTLIRFQKLDAKDPEKIREGAILRFSFAVGADKSVIEVLKKNLPKEVDRRLVRFDPLPLSGIEMTIYDPRGKKVQLIATASQGIAAEYAAQYARFSAVFPVLESDLVETLLKSGSGVKYELNYRYAALSDRKTSRIKIDIGSAGSAKHKHDGSEVLDSNGKEVAPELAAYVKRQVSNPRIAQRLRKIHGNADLASKGQAALDSSYDARSDGRKSSKTREQSGSKIAETLHDLTLVHRSRSQKFLAAQGFLSFARYSEAVQKSHVIEDTAYDYWAYSYMLMPTVGELDGLAVEKIELNIALSDGRYTYETRKLEWKPDSQWRDEHGAPTAIARFALKDLLVAGGSLSEHAFFEVEYSIFVQDDPAINGKDKIPVFTGDLPLSTPFELADVLMFDFSNLYWDAPENDKTRLVKVEIILQDDKRRIRRFVAPQRRSDKTLIVPEQVPVLLTRGNYEAAGKVKLSVFFHTADNKRVPWDFNGMELQETFPDAYLVFLDNDWQRQ